jgi:ATP-dependent 26S proteasome regulatory subunit
MSDFQAKLKEHVKAGYPGIIIRTAETHRAEILCMKTASDMQYGFKRWTITNGWSKTATEKGDKPGDVIASVVSINSEKNKNVLVMHAFPEMFNDPTTRQALRDAVQDAKQNLKTIVLLGQFDLPDDLEKEFAGIEFDLPSRDDLRRLATVICENNKITPPTNGIMAKAIDAALGLTIQEAENAFALSLVRSKSLDVSGILETKKDIIRRGGLLEYVESKESLDTVGGLDVLKGWIMQRASGFSPKAREFGIEAPKGLLLVGVPGCGKSLVAKAMQAGWGLPLLKLDMGRVFGSLVGESESHMRDVFKTAEAIAPCILYIDEFEKALGGGDNDGGTTKRVMASLLNWMQDRPADKPVFIVATANDVGLLPPEFLRKGRWDEIFAVDLPNADERKLIARVHLTKRHREALATEDVLASVSKATEGFTGSEIEEVVKSGLWTAFSASRDLTADDLAEAALNTTPLSKTMEEKVNALRTWAQTRARWATSKTTSTTSEGRTLQL